MCALGFGEGDHVADGVGTGHQHHQTVQADGYAAVGGCAVLQGVQQEAEFILRVFGTDLERTEHLTLHFFAVDTHRAAAHFNAVQHHVVGFGNALVGRGVHQVFMAVFGRGEGVMNRRPSLAIFVVLEHREINHPKRCPAVFKQARLFAESREANFDAQRTNGVVDDFFFVSTEEQQVTVLRASTDQDCLEGGVVQVLDNGTLQAFATGGHVIDLDVGQALGTVNFDELGVAVNLASAQATFCTAAGYAQGGHTAFGAVGSTGENLKFHCLHQVGQFGELHLDTQIGLVGAVQAHTVAISHDGEITQINTGGMQEHLADHAFEHRADVVFGHEGGFNVDLREFRLTVGAQVFVAEAFGDLVVAVKPGHHQQLLE